MTAVSMSFSKQNKAFGLMLLIMAQICLSINVIIGKHLSSHGLTPILILVLRFGIGSIILFTYLLTTNQLKLISNSAFNLATVDKRSLLSQSICSGFLYNILMLSGVQLTSATMAGIFISAEPAIILVLSYVILKERIKTTQIFSIFIVILGIFSLNLSKIQAQGLNSNILGDVVVFAAILPEAIYTIIAKRYPVNLSSLYFAFFVNVINALLFTSCMILFTHDYNLLANLCRADWILSLTLLPISGFMFFLLWNGGLTYSSAQQAGLVTAVVPVGVCILAVLFLHEPIHMYEIIGIISVILAILIGSYAKTNVESDDKQLIAQQA